MAHGDFNHVEFPADDLSRARGFYEAAGQGWYAVVFDTEGNDMGLWEDLPR